VAVRQGFFQMVTPCPRCQGQGRIIPKPCGSCRGAGRVERRVTVGFKIAAGVDRGTRIRVHGQGEGGQNGGPSGDLWVLIDVEPDSQYQRDGIHLHRELDVPWTLMVLGGAMEVDTPYGKDRVKIAAGTPGNHVVKLVNAGVPRLQASGRGDLFLHLRVAVPTALDDGQRALVEQLHQSFGGAEAAPEEEGFLSKVFGSDKGKKKRK
jgi:molecular chaperone DnaJ